MMQQAPVPDNHPFRNDYNSVLIPWRTRPKLWWMSCSPISAARQRRGDSLIWVVTLLLWVAPLGAAPQRDAQRALFLQAEKALQQGDAEGYRRLRKRLDNYPLAPYLDYAALMQKLDSADISQTEHFLQHNNETPLAWQLRAAWLKELANKRRWRVFLTFYRPTGNAELRCHFAQALLETGKQKQAYREIASLWRSGRSRPDACDKPFAQWRKAGQLTRELIWQRIALAMERDNLKLARYLKRFLPAGQRPQLDRWLSLYRNPGKTLELARQSTEFPYRGAMLQQGLQRLASKDPDAARRQLQQLSGKLALQPRQRYSVERYILLRQLRKNPQRGYAALQQFPPAEDDEALLELRLRQAISREDWPRVLEWSRQLPEPLAERERWRYWSARAEIVSGSRERGEEKLRQLARERSYHGFLAADRLGLPYNLNNQPLTPDRGSMEKLARLPAMQRAHELLLLERFTEARREWRLATGKLNPRQLQIAAKLAQAWQWHDRAIFTLARSGYWEDLELRFPLQHRQPVKENARTQALEQSWVYAVIRQESAFDQDARSRTGARGLMQLMPATARLVARRLKLKRPAPHQLYTPDLNIRLGTAYLRQVLQRLGDNPVLATAAYNAGPRRVERWLPEESLAAETWIESIPFDETRTYTQRVMSYTVIYERRLGREPRRLSQRMPRIVGRMQLQESERLAAMASTGVAAADSSQ